MYEYLPRYIEKAVTRDLKRKMVFVGGPRQSGKTTMAKHMCEADGVGAGTLVLDEIHKYSRWRQVVKR